ncbi:hypothetical protein RJ640_016610 [Escallonia rubra]|uniref:Phospholipase A1 n=1 Tax=Escallonia rubra TaxID=112253 RepID=A0AA88R2I2_9ASTE|nr:hypothetical protein RJ640_016610 [Escallonia rubra]
MTRNIAERWKVLSGLDNWKNLLYPLDLDLRQYIIHYGETAQVTYDTFNSDEKSKYAGSSRYGKSNLFAMVGLELGNPFKYRPVKYIYATSQIALPAAFLLKSLSRESWCKESNWMGYIAVATDEGKVALGRRDILIAWRGSVQALEWVDDFIFPLTSASILFGKQSCANVHSGFLSIYTSADPESKLNKISARDQVLAEVKRQVEIYKDEEISITVAGHSLGGSLATLNAVDIATNGYNAPKDQPGKRCPVTAFIFASARVGDSHFHDAFHSTENLHALRINNASDPIPLLPPVGFSDVGEELLIDTTKSNYINFTGDLASRHNLEAAYLHGVAGTQGPNGGFHLVVKRDIALVNKHTGLLKEKYLVPNFWWIERNKGMVQLDDGSWDLDHHEKDDDDDDEV